MPLLAYWNVRGVAQPIRLLLVYVGQEFEERLYDFGSAPDYTREDWFNEKFTLGLDFPNIPYYIDGDKKITQSSAIFRYIGRKHKLDGSTEDEKVLVDVLLEEAGDFRRSLIELCYKREFDQLKTDFVMKAKPKLEEFEKYLANKDFFLGQNITFVDFLVYDLFDQLRIFEPTLLKNTQKINAFMTRIENIPAIKEYMSSSKFISRPLYAPEASFK